ncbi:MAG: hypothetical protein HOE92_04570 [Euryarchaeota archaeon]|jgi:selenocysteine-specific translation elongation factor|nr:hypothetical protein [Euryarchaeota archaeon]MBT3971474.1 hypothetical protein [Euryarchaeota archaeon]
MTVLNVAMIGTDELAREIAKPSDQRDVHTYVFKEQSTSGDARIISIIRPAKFPERLPPLLAALNVGRAGILEVNKVDGVFGEAVVAFASAGIDRGIVVVNPPDGEWVDEAQVKMMVKQAGLDNWIFVDNDGIGLRNKLYEIMDEIADRLQSDAESALVVPVDQHFNVKGIGLVAIGYVQSGILNVHDELFLLPAGGKGDAKSLQVMDDDVKMATAGDRVGIALRNAKEEHLSKGSLIVHPPINDKKTNTVVPLALITQKRSSFVLSPSPFQKRQLIVGDICHIAMDLQFAVGRIEAIVHNLISVEWDSPIHVRRDNSANALLCQLDTKPRIMGAVHKIESLE